MGTAPPFWPLLILLSGAAALAVTFADTSFPLRLPIVLWFILVCPGMALVLPLRLRSPFAEWTLAVALSLAVAALVAGGMLFVGRWSPRSGLVALVAVCAIAVALPHWRAWREGKENSGPRRAAATPAMAKVQG